MVLVVGDDFERDLLIQQQFSQDLGEPGGQRIGIHSDRQGELAHVGRAWGSVPAAQILP